MKPRRHCHAVGCEVELAPHLIMCARHWAMVAGPTKEAIRAVIRGDHGGGFMGAWLLAVAEAVVIVATREGTDASLSPLVGMARRVRQEEAAA